MKYNTEAIPVLSLYAVLSGWEDTFPLGPQGSHITSFYLGKNVPPQIWSHWALGSWPHLTGQVSADSDQNIG